MGPSCSEEYDEVDKNWVSRWPFVGFWSHALPALTCVQTAVGSCAAWRLSRVIRPAFPSPSMRTLLLPPLFIDISSILLV